VVLVVGPERYNKIWLPAKENTLDISLIISNYIYIFNCVGVGWWWGLGIKVCVILFYWVVVLQGLRTPAVSEIQFVYGAAIFIA
jgi:hypothetical protein